MALLIALAAAPAQAEFGFESVDLTFAEADGSLATQAGSHPHAMNLTIEPMTEMDPVLGEIPSGQPRDLWISLPPGLVGTPDATPQCPTAYFSTPVSFLGGLFVLPDCPDITAVGLARIRGELEGEEVELTTPAYNLLPPAGVVTRLGFLSAPTGPMIVDFELNEFPPYEAIASVTGISQTERFYGTGASLWSEPGAFAHDDDRGLCGASLETAGGESSDAGDLLGITCPVGGINGSPLVTLPRSCSGPLETFFEAESWLGDYAEAVAFTHDGSTPPTLRGMGGCDQLDFSPHFSAKPTDRAAGAPLDLGFELEFHDEGLLDPDGIAASDVEEAAVLLPRGVTIDPARLAGLGSCPESDFVAGAKFGDACPSASRIGSVEVETPLLEGVTLSGSVFLGGHLAFPVTAPSPLYMAVAEPSRGIDLALAGEIATDPISGRLAIVFFELPQLPFSDLRFDAADNTPLIARRCGSYITDAFLVPWADPEQLRLVSTSFQLDQGPGGGPCPSTDPLPGGSGVKREAIPGEAVRPACAVAARRALSLPRRAKRLRRAARHSSSQRRARALRRQARRLGKRAKRQRRAARRCRTG